MTTPPQKSILKQTQYIPPPEASSSASKSARIVLSDDEDDDPHFHDNLKYVSDGDDEDVPSGKAVELLEKEKVCHSGFLRKKGEKRPRSWKKRWFVLRTTKLAMYKDEKEYKLLRIIDLHEIHSVVEITSKSKYKYVFAIVTPKRIYYVEAEDQHDMDNWFKAIEAAKKKLPLNDGDDDASSVDRDQEYAKDVIDALQQNHAVNAQQRRRSSGGTTGDRPGRVSAESGDRGEASHVSPVDIPKANRGTGHPSNTPLSDYSNDHSFPLSPNSDHQAQLHVAEGLASSEDDEDYGLHHGQAARSQDKILIEGYLYKLGRTKAWNKRWFVLGNNRLAYYEDEKKDKPHRTIPLTHIMDSHYVDPVTKKKPFCFKVIIPKRSYVLCATSESQMEDWLNALTVAVPRAKKDVEAKPTSHELSLRPLSLIPENADSRQQMQRLSSASTSESFENTSHLSGVSGAGGVGGAGGALGEVPATSDLARIHSRASERLGRAK